MQTTNNTILITGGGSGIGLETAFLFAGLGNKIIITGRNQSKLEQAAARIPGATAIVADVTDAGAVDRLVQTLEKDFPSLNILINNAGLAYAYRLTAGAGAYEKAAGEFNTNVLSTIRLSEKLWPLLEKQPEAAIVNITSVVGMAPALSLPTYSASKAALHSYSQTLRYSLSGTSVKVFEVMPPLVDTEFAKELPGAKIQPQEVATALLEAFRKDIFEVHVAGAAVVYNATLQSPDTALRLLNGIK